MTVFAAPAPVLLRSALRRDDRGRFPWPPIAWLRTVVSEARRAAEAEHRYRQLRYQEATKPAPQGGVRKDASRQVFEEFYA